MDVLEGAEKWLRGDNLTTEGVEQEVDFDDDSGAEEEEEES